MRRGALCHTWNAARMFSPACLGGRRAATASRRRHGGRSSSESTCVPARNSLPFETDTAVAAAILNWRSRGLALRSAQDATGQYSARGGGGEGKKDLIRELGTSPPGWPPALPEKAAGPGVTP